MTTSGTVGQTVIRVVDILEDALQACGVSTVEMTPQIYKTAQQNLYFYLSALANDGIQLWTIQKYIIGLVTGQSSYDLDTGAVDVLNAVYRTANVPPSGGGASSAGGSGANAFDGDIATYCTQTSANGNISYSFSENFSPLMFGILPHGDATYNLVYEYSTDSGATWNTAYAPGSKSYSNLVWDLHDVDRVTPAADWRVRETGGATLDVCEVMFGANPTEINIARLSNDVYANLTNKFQQEPQPLQYWVDRQADRVSLKVWPASDNCLKQIVTYRRRQVQDVGNLTNTLEIPERWTFAIVTGLARYLCMKVPGADLARYPILKEMADEQWMRASMEERDNSPIDIMPSMAAYTGRSI